MSNKPLDTERNLLKTVGGTTKSAVNKASVAGADVMNLTQMGKLGQEIPKIGFTFPNDVRGFR